MKSIRVKVEVRLEELALPGNSDSNGFYWSGLIEQGKTIMSFFMDLASQYPAQIKRVFDCENQRFKADFMVAVNKKFFDPETMRDRELQEGDEILIHYIPFGG